MCKGKQKAVSKVTAVLLTLMMVVVFIPTFAFAESGSAPTEIAKTNCTVIGDYGDEEDPALIHYISIGEANTTVKFTDYPDDHELMVSGMLYTGEGDSNVVDLTEGFALSQKDFLNAYGDSLNEDAKDLDFSNIYGVAIYDMEEYVMDYYIIAGPSAAFQFDIGQQVGFEEDAVEYDDWSTGTAVKKQMDLYTVAIPDGTSQIALDFTEDRLVYAYDKDGGYITSCGAEGDGSYPDSKVGQKKAVVKALEDGSMPAYVYVETPYTVEGEGAEQTWSNTFLFAISFVTYPFEASLNGETITDITYKDAAYTYDDWFKGPQVVRLYTVIVPAGTENVDFKTGGPVLHYNYDKTGNYLSGYFADWTVGDTNFTEEVDSNKDGICDYIQMQIPYETKTSYDSQLLYAVKFSYGDIKNAKVTVKKATYTGKKLNPAVTVTMNGVKLKKGIDYSAVYSSNVNAGKGTVTLKGLENCTGSTKATFTIAKAKNPLKVTAKGKTFKVKKVKSKKQTYKAITATKNQGKVSYKVTYKNSKSKKALSFSKGKVTVKKGTKKGTYKMTVKVTAKGTKNYKAITIPKTITIKVK